MRYVAFGFLLPAFALALLGAVGPASAKPTEAQLAAIKSNCRSDFMSNCWGVPRGGAEAFQCLKQHLAELSPGCQKAVKAVTPPPAQPAAEKEPENAPPPKKTEATPAPAPAAEPEPAPAAAEAPPAAQEPAPAAQEPAPKAASTTPESAPAAPPPKAAPETAAKPPAPKPAAAPAAAPPPASEPAPAAPKAAAVAPEAAPPVIGFLPPRKKLMVLRNCRQDLDTYCAGVDYGDGRQLRCLFSNKAALTPDCQGALAKLTR